MIEKGSHCPAHQKYSGHKLYGRTSKQQGYDSDWTKLRNRKIAADPICQYRLTHAGPEIATEVDHVTPIERAPHLRLSWSNLKSTCHACHVEKHKRAAQQAQ